MKRPFLVYSAGNPCGNVSQYSAKKEIFLKYRCKQENCRKTGIVKKKNVKHKNFAESITKY